MSTGSAESPVSDRGFVSTRLFDAPRALVFRAWTDPAQLAHWWGPKGFTNTFHEFDLRPGGLWRFTMHGPNGGTYPNESTFLEIVEPERIVLRHISDPKFLMTATFEEREGGTFLTWRMEFETVAVFEKVKGYAVEGNRQNLDRLEAHLASLK